jgi:GNAT superfamily N-acetyltransferase
VISKIKVDGNLSEEQQAQLRLLWNREYPVSLAHKTIESTINYLRGLGQPQHTLFYDGQGAFIGWFCVFERENDRWFAMILDENHQRKRLGSSMLKNAMLDYNRLCGWVIDHDNDPKANGKAYSSPLTFYVRNGFSVINEVRLELPTISAVKIVWEKGGLIRHRPDGTGICIADNAV